MKFLCLGLDLLLDLKLFLDLGEGKLWGGVLEGFGGLGQVLGGDDYLGVLMLGFLVLLLDLMLQKLLFFIW